MRIENDTMGAMKLPDDALWGAQTARSLLFFNIGNEKMPYALIRALVLLKRACALSNYALGVLESSKCDAIVWACDEILADKYPNAFPLSLWQTGSGTQTNMNVNEVISALATDYLGGNYKQKRTVHPNDDVNRSQSSNDIFPSAMHLSALLLIEETLLPELKSFLKTLRKKSKTYDSVLKIGRTHLQDATPLTLGQEISGWASMIEHSILMIKNSLKGLRELAIGGTAVGTGINAPKEFGFYVAKELSVFTCKRFISAENKFHALTSHDALVFSHGALKALAANLMKIANDVRWLSSGPRCGIGEIQIPENEPGSSIMPGKVNPTQAEALTMIATKVFGNDTTIAISASQGNFELNVFKPVIIDSFLQSVRLLSDGVRSFNQHCIKGMVPIYKTIESHLSHSLMLVTALNPYIGYENAAKIAKYAHQHHISLKEAAIKLKMLSEEEFERYVDVKKMI